MVIENTLICVKIIFKLTNFNCELIRIMVSKGRINRELGKFFIYIQTLIKFDNTVGVRN